MLGIVTTWVLNIVLNGAPKSLEAAVAPTG
jgi:hypothetical protein